MISDKTYDRLKWIGLIAVPVITFLTSVVNILNVPYSSEIVAILAALDICIGAIVTIAKSQYDKQKKLEETEKIETQDQEEIEQSET